MTLKEECIEAAARALAPTLGPYFEELPRDKPHKRGLSRVAHLAVEHTQADMLEAATAAFAAITAIFTSPNSAMIASAADIAKTNGSGDFVAIWQAMLAAAAE